MRWLVWIPIAGAVLAAFASGIVAPAGASAEEDGIVILSLGDSTVAAHGVCDLPSRADDPCPDAPKPTYRGYLRDESANPLWWLGGNPASAYSGRLAEALGGRAFNFGITGACAATAGGEGAAPGTAATCEDSILHDELSEVDRVLNGRVPAWITIGIGANDIQFAKCLKEFMVDDGKPAWDNPCYVHHGPEVFTTRFTFERNLGALEGNLRAVLARIDAKFPGTEVLVVGYYNFLPPPTVDPCGLWAITASLHDGSERDVQRRAHEFGSEVLGALNGRLAATAAWAREALDLPATFVDVPYRAPGAAPPAGYVGDVCSSADVYGIATCAVGFCGSLPEPCPGATLAGEKPIRIALASQSVVEVRLNCIPHPTAAGHRSIARRLEDEIRALDDCDLLRDASDDWSRPTRIGVGECTGRIAAGTDDHDVFAIAVRAGDRIRATLAATTAGLDADLVLLAPTGNLLAHSRAPAGVADSADVVARESGDHKLVVVHAGGSAGACALSTSLSPNTPPRILSRSCSAEIVAGRDFTCSLSAGDDERNRVRFEIDWGDGATSLAPGASAWAASGTGVPTKANHRYASAGTFPAKVVAIDDGIPPLRSGSETFSLRVLPPPPANLPPTLDLVVCADPVQVGEAAKCSLRAKDDGGSVRFVLDWGDGTGEGIPTGSALLPAGAIFEAKHAFPNPGTFTVRVQAEDTEGFRSAPLSTMQTVVVRPSLLPGDCGLGSDAGGSFAVAALLVAPFAGCAGTLSAADGEDWYQFDARGGQRITLRARRSTPPRASTGRRTPPAPSSAAPTARSGSELRNSWPRRRDDGGCASCRQARARPTRSTSRSGPPPKGTTAAAGATRSRTSRPRSGSLAG